MHSNPERRINTSFFNSKQVLAMKITIVLLISSFVQAFGLVSYSQTTSLSLRLKDVSIEEVLNKIEEQTEFRFLYNKGVVDVARKVNVDFRQKNIQAVLQQLFANDQVAFTIHDRQIVLSSKQTKPVSGQVTDHQGEPLAGVSIALKGSTLGTISDPEGNFVLQAAPGDVLRITYLGYATRELTVDKNSKLQIVLREDAKALEEIVVVGYGTQKRQSVTGAVSQISGTELLKAPVGNVNNLLAGRITGVVSLQTSGQPGADAAGMLVRGGSAKYIVDGFERSFSEIDPNEIETISILKDASSASVYGLDAGAVIIVTTKRGKQSPSSISFTGAYGISENALMLEMLDGPSYAYWYNKATEMDGNTRIFSIDHLRNMEQGINGWGNTNWYKETFGTGHTRNLNLNATGGSESIKYFISLGNYNQEGNVQNYNFNRYNLRSNIDAVIARNLDLTFDVSGSLQERNAPYFGAGKDDFNNIPQQAIRALPFVPKEIDGVPVSTRTVAPVVNPLAASSLSGYNDRHINVLQTSLSLNFRVPKVKGLSLKFVGSYDISYTSSKSFSTPYYTYIANTPTLATKELAYVYNLDSRGDQQMLTESMSKSSYLRTNISARYENRFGLHHLTALALAETSMKDGNSFGATGYGFDLYELDELSHSNDPTKTNILGSSSKARLAGFLGRITYDYAGKYMAEASLRYDGSYVFGGMVPGKRWSSFPAGSLGWRLSEEEWFKQSQDFVDNLKLRTGIGLTGRTGIDPYYYLSTLDVMDNPDVVLGGSPQNGLTTSKPGNVNLSWEKTLQYNVGLDVGLWNDLLAMEFDVFYKYIYDVLVATSQVPASFGGYKPGYENIGKKDHKGFEFTISHRNKAGDFSYRIALNGSYAKRRWLSYPDAANTPDWLKLTGKPEGAQVGFLADGLFQSQEEIDSAPIIEAAKPSIGDIRYIDRNGDGEITYNQDRGYVGKSAYPNFVGGLILEAGWNGFDFSSLFQAGLDRDVALTGVYSTGVMSNTSMTKPFYGSGNSPKYLVEGSWTENNRNAEFPRLSVTPASSNNAYSSTFWYRNGNYLRLKNIQLGYTFPTRWIKPVGFELLRLYVEGQNLLTISQLTKYGIDPEQPGVSNGYYPQQRVYNIGLKLTF